jgi:hypothetical protein
MVDVEASVERTDGVTFVRATVSNTRGTAQIVRLESRLDGPTWPPRRGETTAPEWDGDCWEDRILPGRCRGIGFASPAEPVDPPVELVDVERAPADEYETAAQVLASLDDPRPPRDVVEGER